MPRNLPITRHFEVASMLAADVPIAEIARQFGVSRKTIYTWSQTPEVQSLITDIQADFRAGVKHLALADKTRRFHLAQELADGIRQVIAERKAAAEAKLDSGYDQAMPGEKSGHVAVKQIGVGRSAVREAAFDAAVISSLVKLLEYARKELGEDEATINVRHGGTVRHLTRDLSNLSDEELDHLAVLAGKIEAGEVDG